MGAGINQSLFVLADLDSDQIVNEGADRACKLYSSTTISEKSHFMQLEKTKSMLT